MTTKRMHIHVGVENIADSLRFYTALFGVQPVKVKDDYAKWMLDDPRINFAISTRARRGVDHLGLQVEEEHELDHIRQRLTAADMALFDQGETVCCYARSEKSWVTDPSGIAWEAYQTMQDVQLFSGAGDAQDQTCCIPETEPRRDDGSPNEKSSNCCR